MKKIILLPFILIIGCSHIQKREYNLPKYEARYAEMINKTISELEKFKPTKDTPLAEFDKIEKWEEVDGEISYGIQDKGLINFKNNEWIYIVIVSSWHFDEDGGAPDITLAIDSNENMWLTEAHVCGGIRFGSKDMKKPSSIEDFFNRFTWWMGRNCIYWEKIN